MKQLPIELSDSFQLRTLTPSVSISAGGYFLFNLASVNALKRIYGEIPNWVEAKLNKEKNIVTFNFSYHNDVTYRKLTRCNGRNKTLRFGSKYLVNNIGLEGYKVTGRYYIHEDKKGLWTILLDKKIEHWYNQPKYKKENNLKLRYPDK